MSKKKQQEAAADQDLMKDIKKMEAEKRQKAMEAAGVSAPAEKVSFDAWWMMRAAQIPRKHMKEIIWADMKGRGLSKKEKVEDYDKALEKYGVKLS